jgi:beta-lactamase class D
MNRTITRCLCMLTLVIGISGCSEKEIPQKTTSSAQGNDPGAVSAPMASVLPSVVPSVKPVEKIDEEGLSYYKKAGIKGAMMVLDVETNVVTIVNPEMAKKRFYPASTFKIPNSLIGLTTGVIPDEKFTLKWDGKHRKEVKEWNQDHNLTSAMRNSVLWYYQEVARRVGEKRMQKHLTLFHYGNETMGAPIDQFWLGGKLAISVEEQVGFLRKLDKKTLPVPEKHQVLVRQLLASEEHDGVTMRWKTGATNADKQMVGWMVGFIEKDNKTKVFASVATGPTDAKGNNKAVVRGRLRVPRKLLGRWGMIPEAMAKSTRWR